MSIVGKTIGRYRIIEQLGQGGMAVVYKAYDTRLERDVALKVIRADDIPKSQHARFLKRFEREAKAQARFMHPNIVQVFDYGEHDGAPYLVMAYLPGGTLKAKTGTPLKYWEATGILAPIADALDYAHRRDVLHRDVKPSNILMGEEGDPMLTDFGIAKLLGEVEEATLTGTGLGVGTPQYMAPEQWEGKPVSQTDIYSLGVVFYELVTGRRPFDADTPAAIILQQANEPLRRPAVLAPDLPEHVEKVIYKALAKDPADRYTSMAEFGQVLAELSREGIVVIEAQPDTVEAEEGEPITDDHQKTKKVASSYPEELIGVVDDTDETTDDLVGEGDAGIEFHLDLGETEEKTDGPTPEVDGKEEKTRRSWKAKQPPAWIWLAAGGIVLVGALVYGLVRGLGEAGLSTWLATDTPIPTTTVRPAATITSTSTKTLTDTTLSTATFTPTPILVKESVMTNPVDGAMLSYIPAGEFEMGADPQEGYDVCTQVRNSCQLSWFEGEAPRHMVYLDNFWMYQMEVTNFQYAAFLNELGNQNEGGATWLSVYALIHQSGGDWQADSGYDEHPVVQVTWYGAAAYCEWAGGRLPTEAEWEKAARGGLEGKIYPWGDESPTCRFGAENGARFEECDDGTVPVGSFAANGYGLYDMAGNAWEWVADWYDENYYQNSTDVNPTGLENGTHRVLRGGSWNGYRINLRSANRGRYYPDETWFSRGFRCVIEGD